MGSGRQMDVVDCCGSQWEAAMETGASAIDFIDDDVGDLRLMGYRSHDSAMRKPSLYNR